jgi:hypothetical protein
MKDQPNEPFFVTYETELESELAANPSCRFVYSYYGPGGALGFQGDKRFQEKGYNLAYNFGMIQPRLSLFGIPAAHILTANFSYVLSHPTRILKGLAAYFYAQFYLHRMEIPELSGLTNEDELETMLVHASETRAQAFWQNHVIRYNFMDSFSSAIYFSGAYRVTT